MKDELYVVLMFGSRDWTSMRAIEREVIKLVKKHGTKDLLIIEGGAPGADQMSKVMGHKHNVHVAEVDALWHSRHNGAGPQRNRIMRLLWPNEAIGFHPDIVNNSKGSKDMKKQLDKAGIPVRIVKR